MLTLKELSKKTGIPFNTILYHIQKDENFRSMYWWKENVEIKTSHRRAYDRAVYVCNEEDVPRMLEYMATKKEYKKREKTGWSDIAIHCWERKMTCEGCNFEYYCSKFTHPPLKKKVLEFVRLYGEPRC